MSEGPEKEVPDKEGPDKEGPSREAPEIDRAPSGREQAVVSEGRGGDVAVGPGRDTPGGTGPGVKTEHEFPDAPDVNKTPDDDVTIVHDKQ
jgi:hypothetical protein